MFSRSFLSSMKKSGLKMALACFLGTAIPACSPNHTGTIPVIVTSPSPSSSPVNGTWQEGILPKRVDAISGNESTNAGFGSHTGSGGNPNYQTAISGGSTIGAGATTDCSLATSTATFGKTSGESTPCPKSTSAGNPWGPSNASPSPSASPSIGGSTIGGSTTSVIGGGSGYVDKFTKTTDCSAASFTSGSQQIDVKATPCPKSTSAG